MKVSPSLHLLLIALGLTPVRAQPTSADLKWTNTSGITIRGEFVKLENDAVVITKDGKPFTVPLAKLSPESISQARELAGAPAEDQPESAPDKPVSGDHQRKLAESLLSKGAHVEIWRGSGGLKVTSLEILPKGFLELKSFGFGDGTFTADDAKLLVGCDRLESIGLWKCMVDDLPLGTLKSLINLEVYRCRVSSGICKGLAGNKSLRKFSLHRSSGADGAEIVRSLGTCPNLESINLAETGMAAISLQPLSGLKLVKFLGLNGSRLSAAELAPVGGISSLESLLVERLDLKSHTLDFLPKLRNLRNLQLAGAKLPPSALTMIAGMSTLNSLDLAGTDVTSETIVALGGIKELRMLGLDDTSISAEVFENMKPFSALEELRLRGKAVRVGETGIKAILKTCPSLRTLNLTPGDMGATGASLLGEFKQLTTLRLSDAKALKSHDVSALAKMDKLALLDLSGSSLTDSQVAVIALLKRTLGELYLRDIRLTDACVPAVKEMKSLRILAIIGTDISKEKVAELRQALPNCRIDY